MKGKEKKNKEKKEQVQRFVFALTQSNKFIIIFADSYLFKHLLSKHVWSVAICKTDNIVGFQRNSPYKAFFYKQTRAQKTRKKQRK